MRSPSNDYYNDVRINHDFYREMIVGLCHSIEQTCTYARVAKMARKWLWQRYVTVCLYMYGNARMGKMVFPFNWAILGILHRFCPYTWPISVTAILGHFGNLIVVQVDIQKKITWVESEILKSHSDARIWMWTFWCILYLGCFSLSWNDWKSLKSYANFWIWVCSIRRVFFWDLNCHLAQMKKSQKILNLMKQIPLYSFLSKSTLS